MISRVALALALLGSATEAGPRGLTVDEVRYLISASGFNPGTVRQLGENGRYVLRSVAVEPGHQHGEFVVRIKVDPI